MTQDEDRGKKPGRDSLNHVHLLITMTDVARDHQHVVVGTTGPAMPSGNSHIHAICLRTSYDPKVGTPHWHLADEFTGPAVPTPNGEHIHFFCGDTTFDAGHRHCFSGATDASIDTRDHDTMYDCYDGYHYPDKMADCDNDDYYPDKMSGPKKKGMYAKPTYR